MKPPSRLQFGTLTENRSDVECDATARKAALDLSMSHNLKGNWFESFRIEKINFLLSLLLSVMGEKQIGREGGEIRKREKEWKWEGLDWTVTTTNKLTNKLTSN